MSDPLSSDPSTTDEPTPPRPVDGRIDWRGIWVPLTTPMRGDGAIDRDTLRRQVAALATQGVAGFVACGSTGEAATLSPDEQSQVLGDTRAAAGPLPVMMGLQGVDATALADTAQRWQSEQPGVAAFLLAAPPYLKPPVRALQRHFVAVADRLQRPLVVYDVPARTGVRLPVDLLLELAGHPRIQAVKDCSGDRSAAQALLDDGRLALLAGNDDELFDQLARGAAGGITATAQLAPAATVALHRLLQAGDLPAARQLWRQLAPLVDALFAEPNPVPLKSVLAALGQGEAVLRPPLTAALPQTVAAALQAWRAVTPVHAPRKAPQNTPTQAPDPAMA